MRAGGLVDDEKVGCPMVGGLVAMQHPTVALAREGNAALLEAVLDAEGTRRRPVGRLFGATTEGHPSATIARKMPLVRRVAWLTLAAFVVGVALLVALAGGLRKRPSA